MWLILINHWFDRGEFLAISKGMKSRKFEKSIQGCIQRNLLNSNYGLLFHSCIGLGSILAEIQEDHEKFGDS